MEYSDEYLLNQLPGNTPPSQLVPVEVELEINSYIEHGDYENRALLARSVRWTYSIFSELGFGHYRLMNIRLPLTQIAWGMRSHGLLEMSSVGLYDPDREERGFGLCIDVLGDVEQGFDIIGYIQFTRLQQTFPLAVRHVITELHSAPNPVNATTSCWAKCNATGDWGVITAGHAVGTSLQGVSVPMDDGSVGILRRSFWQPIDAAFVITPAPQHQPNLLQICNFPAAGIPVAVECQSRIENRKVASACNSQGFYKTRSWPVLFFLDNPCISGDSGALVRLRTGEAAGIYLGAEPSPVTGGTSGRALNFAQAMFSLHTTPYR